MSSVITIIVALGSIAGLALYLLKRFYGPPPKSRQVHKLKCKIQDTRYEIVKELDKIKKTSASKRDYTRYGELLAERKRLLEQLDTLQTS